MRPLEAVEVAKVHPTRAQLEALIERWLASRPIAPMGFLVQIDPFTDFTGLSRKTPGNWLIVPANRTTLRPR